MTLQERLERRLVRQPNGCLEWQGSRLPKGYGQIGVKGMPRLTHRVAWELANGPIPDGLNVLHHCDNPPCGETEPSEEYPETGDLLGTQGDNMADKTAKGRGRCGNAGKTHCIRNHEFTAENTYLSPAGKRECRTCNRVKQAAYLIRRKS